MMTIFIRINDIEEIGIVKTMKDGDNMIDDSHFQSTEFVFFLLSKGSYYSLKNSRALLFNSLIHFSRSS